MNDMFKGMSDFEINASINGIDNAYESYREKIGKFVIGKFKDGRVFLISLYTYSLRDKKQGRWNTFSVCNEKLQNDEIYIFRITDMKKDKTGYPLFILRRPFGPLGNNVCKDEFLSLLLTTGLFADSYPKGIDMYNYRFAAKNVGISEYEELPIIARGLFDRFIVNEISIDNIIEWFNEPSDERKELDRRYESLNDIPQKYPNLSDVLKRRQKGNNLSFTNMGIYDIVDFYYGKYLEEFYNKSFQNLQWIEKAEIAAKALNERYAAKKAAEKAERKARKAALKLQKKGE